MHTILILPVDVLCNIFSLCEPANITETCQDFAAIAYSIPSLWSSIRLGPLQLWSANGEAFLRARLRRVGASPLTITIGPLKSGAEYLASGPPLFAIISEYSAQIKRLEITAETAMLACQILIDIFPTSVAVFPALQALSIRVEEDLVNDKDLPQLDKFLEGITKRFPMLQSLLLPSYYNSLPMLPIDSGPFANLRTLILDGSMEHIDGSITLITALLHNTPQLETFWYKHYCDEQFSPIGDPFPLEIKNRSDIRTPARLPNLSRLAVSVPGSASDLIFCIEAPALRDLHLDGIHGPRNREPGGKDIVWGDYATDTAEFVIRAVAAQCSRALHRLAITSIYIGQETWEWLLFGEGQGRPFPQLESLSLHRLEPYSGEKPCGFDNALLRRYAHQPGIHLRRLAFVGCNLDLEGSSIVQIFQNMATNRIFEETHELEFDISSIRFSEEDLGTLTTLGVKVFQHEEAMVDEWWTRGYKIDGSDSHAY
ncbi:hypothetical protein AX15_006022 [Amanita polypyramis BW_CC]|nr:hypothetical protein AX15_006022 [Amanita polypyramis BW_CC]